MPIDADTLLDRLYLKNQITRWRLIAILAVIGAGVFFFEGNAHHSPIERSFIGRVTIDGIITDDIDRDRMMREIAENKKIKAVIVRLDTPGGSAVAGMTLFKELRRIAETKPVVAVMRDLSASAGYLTALGADRIFANEGTITGSIGVIIETAEFTGLAEKLGVTPIIVKTGPLKDQLSPFSKTTPEATRAAQDLVNSFFQVFVDTVAARRKLPREEVLKLADGRAYAAPQALDYKLIDAIGGEEEAVAWLEKDRSIPADLDIKDIEAKKPELPWLERITQSMAQKIAPLSAGKLDGLVAIWHPSLQIQ